MPSINPVSVSFERDILPLFRPMDIQCMRGQGAGFLLADYQFMSAKDDTGAYANASLTLDHLTGDETPRMPFGGPYWSDESIDLFRSWIKGGCLP